MGGINIKAVVIYFSGTGNTEYIAKLFKEEFNKNSVECDLVDIIKTKKLEVQYDYYVFGSTIHVDVFPSIYIDWIKNNLKNVKNKKCIVFSTQSAKIAAGADELSNLIIKKGFETVVRDYIQMPNNFYVVMFKKTTEDEVKYLKLEAAKKVREMVSEFLNKKINLKKTFKLRAPINRAIYKLYCKNYAKNWAKKHLKVNNTLCIKCKKCVNNCPGNNIDIKDTIIFDKKCICCQRCLHICPTNAFLYKERPIEQYERIKFK